jgi:hypothetical protein
MGKKSMGQRLAGVDRTPEHPHARALVWHPYLLDKSVEVSRTLERRHQTTTPQQALSVLLRHLEAAD